MGKYTEFDLAAKKRAINAKAVKIDPSMQIMHKKKPSEAETSEGITIARGGTRTPTRKPTTTSK